MMVDRDGGHPFRGHLIGYELDVGQVQDAGLGPNGSLDVVPPEGAAVGPAIIPG
jgi:hypothetical protein